MYDGMNLYRAIVAYASPTTGEIQVRIPSILGPTEVVPVSRIGRADSNGTWQVPLVGSQTVVAVEDDRFSHVYMVYPNLGTISAGGGGGGGGGGGAIPSYGVPSGTIVQYAGATAPTSWLLCNGDLLPRADYADLFEAIGTAYGAGDGSTTFRIPNLSGKMPIGLDPIQIDFSVLNNTGGSVSTVLGSSNLPAHAHSLSSHTHGLSSHTHTLSHSHTGSTDQNQHDHGDISSSGAHGHTVSRNFWGDALSGGGTTSGTTANWSSVNISGGSHSHTIALDTHSHSLTIDTNTTNTTSGPSVANSGGPSVTDTGDGPGTASPILTISPYIVVNYIIKV